MGQRDSQKTVKEPMYHFFVPEAGDGPLLTIQGADAHHIKHVLRMKPGEKIVISNGRDRDFYCRIQELGEDTVTALVQPETVEESELPSQITLYQGLPKGDKMELIIQKAVELGAFRIVPVAMKRCVAKLDAKKQKSKGARWQAIAESAAKQSGRRIIPEVGNLMSYSDALREAQEMDLVLLPYENARGMASAKEALDIVAPGQRIAVFIGPEGGLESAEAEAAEAAGARTISLGRRILRTETAGLAILSLLMLTLELQQE